MRIALSGYYGFDNAGDEALLSAITSTIKKLEPAADFVVFSGHPRKTSSLHGIRAVYYLHPGQILRELFRADLLISGGGSIFQDITSARSLPYYISVVALAKFLGKPVIFYAQGVGPINRSLSKFLMRLVGNRVDLITLRDHDSAVYLERLGVSRPPMIITSDPVFSLQPEPGVREEMDKLLQEMGLRGQVLVGVAVRQWLALEGYQESLARVLDELAERGCRILFIPMAYPEDIPAARKVMNLMKNDAWLLERPLGAREHLALIAHLDIMIGMRLHALIFAASQGVPFAGISYDPKVDAFLKLFEMKPLPLAYEDMKAEIERVLEDNEWRERIRQRAGEMREKSVENARLALSLLR
ncbi:polysaccharide pyruvyl transferase CsaB [Syntrophomonas wolfei]|jgi:polysaccharide pyruvyl transferase CsaB|nr:polysaccharide pyruvyl transferase CsaB [Syntrophomonas wolfei]